jgi:hypothetical protein
MAMIMGKLQLGHFPLLKFHIATDEDQSPFHHLPKGIYTPIKYRYI